MKKRRNHPMMKMFCTLAVLVALITPDTLYSGSPWGDYTFYSPKNTAKAYLVDMAGNNYHTWTFTSGGATGYSAYLLPGGVIVRSVVHPGNYFTGGPICGEVQKVDWNGNILWDYVYSTTAYCSHHDIHPMPNGNVLLIAYESKTPAEVTAAGCSQNITMWPDKIVEIQPVGTTGGNVVWEWKAWDHLCQNYNSAKANYVTSIVQHPELLNINYNTAKDWMHVNGVDYNEALDQITFSSHMLNEIYVIDHSTTMAEAAGHTGGNAGKGGDILYRWGNPAAYQASGTTNFNIVHNAHWIPADCPHAGYLVGFNNKGGAGQKNCIDLINPPINGYNYNINIGSAFAPSTYFWRHTYSGTPTSNEGHSQQLPNGNMLITISLQGYAYEIDSNQTVVWSKTISGGVTNVRRYTACYVNGPLTVNATASTNQGCPGTTVQLNASASGGSTYTYAWTSIPPGFTSALQNPVVTPSATTSYICNVTSGSCAGADTVTYTLTSQPTVTAAANPQQVCPGGTCQLSATPSGTANYTYSWTSNPAGFTSSLQNPVVNPLVATTYMVTLTNGTCTASNSVTVGMQAPPSVIATATPQVICPNQSSQLLATPSGTANYTYSWSSVPAGFTSAIPNPTVGPSVSTLYIVNISAQGCNAGDSVLVTVDPIPATPVITRSGDSLVSSATTGNQWFKDGSLITGATGQYLTITGLGSYTVQVTNSTGCVSAMSSPFIVVGVNDLSSESAVRIFPNPTGGQVTLSGICLENGSFTVQIYNSIGKQAMTLTNEKTFPLATLDNGLYYMIITTDRQEIIRKKIILVK